MTIHCFEAAPPDALATELERFERQFTYPLGVERTFHIAHGDDYPRFFRAIGGLGLGVSFVAEANGGEVLGTLGVALRSVQLPNGETAPSAYLGDLKTVPDGRRARTLIALAARAIAWATGRGARAAYGVVMDGTPRSPSTYSGRCGIPAFGVAGSVCVLRVPVSSCGREEDPAFRSDAERVERRFRALSQGRFAPLGGDEEGRSHDAPLFLLAPEGGACGVLEDTRRAKRLMLDDGSEMVSAHLSKFAYADVRSGVALLREASTLCEQYTSAPALFVSVPEVDRAAFLDLLEDTPGIIQAPATIYSAGFPPSDHPWNLSTAEI